MKGKDHSNTKSINKSINKDMMELEMVDDESGFKNKQSPISFALKKLNKE